jgi:broad specificity phosphatase PhoE
MHAFIEELPCDTKAVDAWIRGRYSYSAETWNQFCKRVATCRLKMTEILQDESVVVFTSAYTGRDGPGCHRHC